MHFIRVKLTQIVFKLAFVPHQTLHQVFHLVCNTTIYCSLLPLKIRHHYPWAFTNKILSNDPDLPLPPLSLLWLTFAPLYTRTFSICFHLLLLTDCPSYAYNRALYKDQLTPLLQCIQRIFGNHRNKKFFFTYFCFLKFCRISLQMPKDKMHFGCHQSIF